MRKTGGLIHSESEVWEPVSKGYLRLENPSADIWRPENDNGCPQRTNVPFLQLFYTIQGIQGIGDVSPLDEDPLLYSDQFKC